jgi:hypothetical protein
MNIWSTREKSVRWLNNELKPQSQVLEEGFDHLSRIIKLFDELGDNEGESEIGRYCRICGITLAKYSHLLIGNYSLMLDGLAQEAGALLRLLIEAYELLVYFRQDKSRVNEVIEDKLPSPGIIGKRISGDYRDLRDYLNANASHFSYKMDSMRHLFDENIKIHSLPNHSLKVFRTNLQLLNAFQVFILFEAVNCLFAIEFDANTLADEIEEWRDTCVKIFPPEK